MSHQPTQALQTTGRIDVFEGYLSFEGARISVSFHAAAGASVAEKDAAFMAALAQQAEINYVAIGTLDTI